MHKKIILLASLPFLLSSCNKVQIPDDIAQFLFTIDFEEAEKSIHKIQVTNQSTLYDKNKEELGSSAYTLSVVRGEKEDYLFQKDENYHGDMIVQEKESKLYATEIKTSLSYDSLNNLYQATISVSGYKDDKLEGEQINKKHVYQYTPNQLKEDVDSVLFYTSDVEGFKTGGLFYADFFKRNINAVEHYSIQDNRFVYSIKDTTYQQGSQKASVTEKIVMNADGMLNTSFVEATNLNTGASSVGEMVVKYNEETGL